MIVYPEGSFMPKISRIEVFQVDLTPKVLRSDAIQAFTKQFVCGLKRGAFLNRPFFI
jgi:hypothetical protein